MTVVADASTLIGLSRIGKLSLLARLYDQVIMPQAVYDEVASGLKPGSRHVKEARYLKVEKIQDEVAMDLLLGSFGRGEAEVLILASEKRADTILIDERKARKVARRAGFLLWGFWVFYCWLRRKDLFLP